MLWFVDHSKPFEVDKGQYYVSEDVLTLTVGDLHNDRALMRIHKYISNNK
jgi:hypothetical protein